MTTSRDEAVRVGAPEALDALEQARHDRKVQRDRADGLERELEAAERELEQARAELDYLERFGTMQSYRDRAEAAEQELEQARAENEHLHLDKARHGPTRRERARAEAAEREASELRERVAELTDTCQAALEAIAPCVVGWGDQEPAWVTPLQAVVSRLQNARAAVSTGEDK